MMGIRNDVHRYTSNGEETKDHVHSLVRLTPPQDGYRYQCRVCNARLKLKTGVMVDDLRKLINLAKSSPSESGKGAKLKGKQALAEIAARIDAHLKRFEADPEINGRQGSTSLKRFWSAGAGLSVSGRKVRLIYKAYQGHSMLTKGDAETYLAWLDAGNVGCHWEALREAEEKGVR